MIARSRTGRRRGITSIAVAAAAGVVVASGALAGCSSSGSSADTLVLYNGQHESTTTALVADFTKRTGIKVKVRSGEDPELANQILTEGSAAPADVFYTENSPALELLSEKGLLSTIPTGTLDLVPAQYSSPKGDYVGIAARETVLLYNPAKISESQLPASLLDLAAPAWKGRVGVAPSGGDFQTIASAVVAISGESAASAWFKGLATNGKFYQSNSAIMQAVNRGEIPLGVTYHYYYFRDQAESGTNSGNVQLHYFGRQDPGAFLSISAAAVLDSSKHKAAADKLVAYLAGPDGQRELATSDDFEYPLNPAVPANAKLRPLDQLDAPKVDLTRVGDSKQTVRLMQDAGLI
jgi:iron(III) transport system substrate-binding protein